MRIGSASGTQIAVFTFAGLLLVVPLSRWIVGANEWAPEHATFIERFLPVLAMGAVLLAVPPLRRWSAMQLEMRLPPSRWREVLLVTAAGPTVAFAAVGIMVWARWAIGGPTEVAQWTRGFSPYDVEMGKALGATGLAALLVAAVIGPIVEELLFRGLLYRAWEERWGWVLAMLLSSLVFGAYHGAFWTAFVLGLLCTAVYRRTGTLLAPILVHAVYNGSLWYPFLGRFVFPANLDVPGDLHGWAFHLSCVLFVALALPAYLVVARTPAPAARQARPA